MRVYRLAGPSDPDLSVESVAAAHRMSTRYLYKPYRGQGSTPVRWIRSEWRARVRRDLADPLPAGARRWSRRGGVC